MKRTVERNYNEKIGRSFIVENYEQFTPNGYETLIAISKGHFLADMRGIKDPFFSSSIKGHVITIETTVDRLLRLSRLEDGSEIKKGIKDLKKTTIRETLEDGQHLFNYKAIEDFRLFPENQLSIIMFGSMWRDILDLCIAIYTENNFQYLKK